MLYSVEYSNEFEYDIKNDQCLLDHGYAATSHNNSLTEDCNKPKQAKFTSPIKGLINSPIAAAKTSTSENTCHTSLGLITKKFVNLLLESPNGIIDLNIASAKLNVQKRRIYDVTNVLEGVGILEKKFKNTVQWKYGNTFDFADEAANKELQLDLLEQKENNLDQQIKQIRDEINSQCESTTYAYITNNDFKNIDMFTDQIVIFVNAPAGAQVTLSESQKIHFKTDKGEIDVFLFFCSDDIDNTSDPKEHSKGKLSTSTYPLRSDQQNLNKIMCGSDDDNGNAISSHTIP